MRLPSAGLGATPAAVLPQAYQRLFPDARADDAARAFKRMDEGGSGQVGPAHCPCPLPTARCCPWLGQAGGVHHLASSHTPSVGHSCWPHLPPPAIHASGPLMQYPHQPAQPPEWQEPPPTPTQRTHLVHPTEIDLGATPSHLTCPTVPFTRQLDYVAWCQRIRLVDTPRIADRIRQQRAQPPGGDQALQQEVELMCLTDEEVGVRLSRALHTVSNENSWGLPLGEGGTD
jgi:hypothetical protein